MSCDETKLKSQNTGCGWSTSPLGTGPRTSDAVIVPLIGSGLAARFHIIADATDPSPASHQLPDRNTGVARGRLAPPFIAHAPDRSQALWRWNHRGVQTAGVAALPPYEPQVLHQPAQCARAQYGALPGVEPGLPSGSLPGGQFVNLDADLNGTNGIHSCLADDGVRLQTERWML